MYMYLPSCPCFELYYFLFPCIHFFPLIDIPWGVFSSTPLHCAAGGIREDQYKNGRICAATAARGVWASEIQSKGTCFEIDGTNIRVWNNTSCSINILDSKKKTNEINLSCSIYRKQKKKRRGNKKGRK